MRCSIINICNNNVAKFVVLLAQLLIYSAFLLTIHHDVLAGCRIGVHATLREYGAGGVGRGMAASYSFAMILAYCVGIRDPQVSGLMIFLGPASGMS